MDLSSYHHEASISIDRSPEELYDMITDVSQMGRWSPVCTGGSYDGDGGWFTGTNKVGDATWETRCRVIVADRGREFTFINHGPEGHHEMVRWGFRFRPARDGGTNVTQTWEVLPAYQEGLGMDDAATAQLLSMMKGLALDGMPATLAALKRDAESGAS